MLSTPGRALCAIVLIVSVQATARAQDVVEVQNGDKFTGTVRHLEHGRLSFATPSAGTISINWMHVVSLTSPQALTVELVSGDRYFGSISTNASSQIVVATSSGPSPPLDKNQIIRIRPVGSVFQERMSATVEFGLNYTNAQNARSYTVGAEAEHRTRYYETIGTFNSLLTARSDASTISRNDFDIAVRRRLQQRWFALGEAKLQEDNPLELDLRFLLAGGAGRRLVQTNRMNLAVEGGLAYNAESYKDAVSTDHSAEVLAGTKWDWFDAGSAVDANVFANAFISLARERLRLDVDGKIRRDFFWNLYWAFDLVERFDSAPPADRPRTDFGLSATLGWTF